MMVLALMMIIEIVPAISADFMMSALRSGAIPLPCDDGFEKANSLHYDVCGPDVYGAYLTEGGFTWNPPHKEFILECLGPEICPAMSCIDISGKPKGHTTKKVYDGGLLQTWSDQSWYDVNKLASATECDTSSLKPCKHNHGQGVAWNDTVLQSLPAYKECIDETGDSLAPSGEFFAYNITNTKYRLAVDFEVRSLLRNANAHPISYASEPNIAPLAAAQSYVFLRKRSRNVHVP